MLWDRLITQIVVTCLVLVYFVNSVILWIHFLRKTKDQKTNIAPSVDGKFMEVDILQQNDLYWVIKEREHEGRNQVIYVLMLPFQIE